MLRFLVSAIFVVFMTGAAWGQCNTGKYELREHNCCGNGVYKQVTVCTGTISYNGWGCKSGPDIMCGDSSCYVIGYASCRLPRLSSPLTLEPLSLATTGSVSRDFNPIDARATIASCNNAFEKWARETSLRGAK